MAEADSKTAPTDDSRCVAALQALAAGTLATWHGLAARCSPANAEKALGAPTGESGTGDLGGVATPFQTYAATAAAPEGIVVWSRDAQIVLVRVGHPQLAEAIDKSLGAPEGKEPSLLASAHAQWIYASRGLVAHVFEPDAVKPFALYAFPPMSLDAFRASFLAKLETRRIRQR